MKKMIKNKIDKINNVFFRSESGSSLHSQTDSANKATAATNQNNVLSKAMAIKVNNAMPIQTKKCCVLFINPNIFYFDKKAEKMILFPRCLFLLFNHLFGCLVDNFFLFGLGRFPFINVLISTFDAALGKKGSKYESYG